LAQTRFEEANVKNLWKEFQNFILRGNAIDLAVGVIIGAAFGSVITSLVNDIIMPPIGLLLGKVDFSDLYVHLNPSVVPLAPRTPLAVAKEQGAVVLAYGNFITTLLNFLIVALCIFLAIRGINQLQAVASKRETLQETEKEEPTEKLCPFCQLSIPVQAIRCPHCTSQLEA